MRFKNQSLKRKLIFIYTIVGVIPVIVMFCINFFQMKTILRNNATESIRSYLYQATETMDNDIAIYNNLSNYVSFNQSMAQTLSYEYSSIYEMYDQFSLVIDPLLSSLMYFHDEIDSIAIYLDRDIVKHGTTIVPISEIENESWVKEVKKDNYNHWYVNKNDKSVFAAGKMVLLDRQGMEGILHIKVDYNAFFQPFEQALISNCGVFITDENDEMVYSTQTFDEKNTKYILNYNDFKKIKDSDSDKYKILSNMSESTGWTIWFYKPDKLIITSTTPIVQIAIITIFLCLCAAVMSISATSNILTKRIIYLQDNMRRVENGNFSIDVKDDSLDEVGYLINGFGRMVKKLNELINEVYESRLKEKEYEMKALQAQINPHFLYNTLSLINWKAIENGADDISSITLALSTFYRTSLNKGKNIMCIRDEIDNMKSYLSIQLVMHDYEFDAEIDVDENIMEYKTLNLILQPLIENAIDHGIDINENVRGKIIITGKDCGTEIELSVADNGVGMEPEQMEKILTKDSKGYGVRNVNERIKLYYGKEYSLKIESKIGQGTKVIVRFPKIY